MPTKTNNSKGTAEAMCPEQADGIRLSPFYHSAVNTVTEPGRFVACSHYFVTRWMPLLGGEGTRIVLALRSLGYYNPKTGERRDQIVVGHAELAARVGCSEDTLTRHLSVDRQSGRPRNSALAHFVERERRVRRDPHTGRVWQEENAYRVAMDDPVHPDDWGRVTEAVKERETQPLPLKTPTDAIPQRATKTPTASGNAFVERLKVPGLQNAVSGTQPGPQNAWRNPHSADSKPRSAEHKPQSAVPLKGSLYSSSPEETSMTALQSNPSSIGEEEQSSQKITPNDTPRLLPGQTGYEAFKGVVAQLRAKEPTGRTGASRRKSERPPEAPPNFGDGT